MPSTSTQLSFDEAVAALGRLRKRGWRLGLDRMEAYVRLLGLQDALGATGSPSYVHVAGTNGKGSTTAFIQNLLLGQGYRTGGFFSPYVFDVRERVQFGGSLIPREDFARLVSEMLEVGKTLENGPLGGPTEFELKTALGFAFWRERHAEWVALEVGLGGRLDSTNVITPAAGVITSIGYDHMHILGSTLEKIATEKAGIAKPGRPLVVGQAPDEATAAIERVAREVGAPLWRFGREVALSPESDGYRVCTPGGSYGGLVPGIAGAMQGHNMALAIAASEAAGAIRKPERIAESVRRVALPGRFQHAEWRGRRLILDGAHNREAVDVLIRSLFEEARPGAKHLYFEDRAAYDQAFQEWLAQASKEPRIVLVSGMVQGHEPAAFYGPLAPLIRQAHLSAVKMERARDPEELCREVGGLFRSVAAHSDFGSALDAATEAAGDDVVLVTGSFYVVGEVGALIGLA